MSKGFFANWRNFVIKSHFIIQHIETIFTLRDCLMRIKVNIAIYQSKAIFNGYCCPSWNFNFIKGTLHNLKNKIQRMNGPTILDCLNNSRCGSFHCVCMMSPKSAWINTQGFRHFPHLICILELCYPPYRTSRSSVSSNSLICEYDFRNLRKT